MGRFTFFATLLRPACGTEPYSPEQGNGALDTGCATVGLFVDADGDGYGNPRSPTCGPSGVADATDCDDGDPDVHPDATEVCNDGRDDDCDGGPGECGFSAEYSLVDADEHTKGSAAGDFAAERLALPPTATATSTSWRPPRTPRGSSRAPCRRPWPTRRSRGRWGTTSSGTWRSRVTWTGTE